MRGIESCIPMSKSWPKVLRDPIHDLILFYDKPWDRLLWALLDCKEVQRLRRIKQLGFSELVFPGANHNRFAHSVGVLHVAKKFLQQYERATGTELTDDQKAFILSAALLHDVGHGPVSHAFEKVTKIDHEKWTGEIIGDSATDVNKTLLKHGPELPSALSKFFDPEADKDSPLPFDLPACLKQIVTSQFDADRSDYLLRDSHSTGVGYGRYDLDWLLIHLHPHPDGKRFVLRNKALTAIEGYVTARYDMYRTVYFHKTTRAAEVMLRLVFDRFKELLGDTPTADHGSQLAEGAPEQFLAAFTGQMSLSGYLELDDHALTEFLRACSQSSDATLGNLATGLLSRRLFKVRDVTSAPMGQREAFRAAVAERFSSGDGLRYRFVLDTPGDTPYKPYEEDSENSDKQIFVEDGNGKPRNLTQLSKQVKELQESYEFVRYYYPNELRVEIDGLADQHLKKG